ncbi:hypothetical protein DL770_010650 [Monosporascus sp. CRB-9-2]|nr:hypothetical protein DL770_010650 [Monosporascus sp. CRB-9-2]
MATVASTSSVIYKGPKDWDHFKREFQFKAYALDVWDYIDPDQSLAWPVRPTKPDIASYPKRRLHPSTRTSTPSSEGTIQVEEVDPTGHPTNILEMTTEGREAYNLDFMVYTYMNQKYDTFCKSVDDLTKWVLESVSPAIKETHLLPGKDLREWYAKLAESGKAYDGRLMINTRREYFKRLKQASKAGKKLDEWVMKWQEIMAQGQRHGVPETKTATIWVRDLCTALAPIVETWATAFRMLKKAEIDSNTISYQEVAADFLYYCNDWHRTRIDYFDLASVTKDLKAHRKKKYCSDAEEKLRLVTHPSFELPVLMKIVEFPRQFHCLETETRTYQVLDGKDIAPRFLGHVMEAGRVVGFLLEWKIEGARPADVSDLGACIGALQRLHEQGLTHGTPHLDDLLVKEGKVILIDFEEAESRVDALARAKDTHYLTSSMLGRDPYYGYDYSSGDEEADECELYRGDDGTS